MTNELSSANVSLLNQYKYIAFNIFFCRIFIISYKMLIITNEKINELAIYRILCRNFTFFYRQEKSKSRRSLKLKFSNSCFVLLHVLVFRKHDISLFWDNRHFFKDYQVKVPQNCFNSSNCTNQTCIQVSKFCFHQISKKLIWSYCKLS